MVLRLEETRVLSNDEIASAMPAAEPLSAGEIVSSGTLTESHPISPGDAWTAVVDGLELPDLTLRAIA